MFKGNMVTEAIPSRVFSLYRIVAAKKKLTKDELRKEIEPEHLKSTSATFNATFAAAQELELITSNDNAVTIANNLSLKAFKDFRYYSICKIHSFSDGQFYRVTNAVLNLNEEILKFNGVSDPGLIRYLNEKTNDNLSETMMRGWRLWVDFLGFGNVDNVFLPNAYQFVKHALYACAFTKGEVMKIDSFLERFSKYGAILIENYKTPKSLNLAFSSALRQLHENNEIVLIHDNDQKINWTLYPSALFFNDTVTAIEYRGVKL